VGGSDGLLLVLDGDAHQDPQRAPGSTSIIRLNHDGEMHLQRHGINDAEYEGTDDEFLEDLRRRHPLNPLRHRSQV
jgi:hypothetical protein